VLATVEAAPAPAESFSDAAATRGEVVLVPLGKFPEDLLDEVESRLVEEFTVTVRRHAPVPLPKSAYYPPRKRYRAEKLLDHLHTVEPDPDARVLGLTSVDISTSKGKYKDWGIFGLGELPGRTSVISVYRLRRKAKDRDHLKFRVGTTAVHEIGHTFGLDHCPERQARCVMQDAEGSIANTDSSTGHLGPACRKKLERKHPL
jgi:archaemetzincin